MPTKKIAFKSVICFFALSVLFIGFVNFAPSISTSATPEEFKGKNFVGYQAWFNTADDGSGRNWVHWGQDSVLNADHMAIDMWPDVSEYPERTLVRTPFTLGNGQPAKLFSSFHQDVINLHFKWMREYSIDGAFLQWFISEPADYRLQIAQKVKSAAELNNREFSIMFDISGFSNTTNCNTGPKLVECIKQRWESAVDSGVVTSASYTKHKNKPLVSIWGIGFTHNSNLSPEQATELIKYFQSADNAKYQASVMGGVGSNWRTLDADTLSDPKWRQVFALFDIISPWTVGRFDSEAGAAQFITSRVKPDIELVLSRDQKYLPVIFAGFSWNNLKRGTADSSPLNKIPRHAGQFLWTQAREYAKLNLKSVYTAMFDEVDEGTAIFKVSPTKQTAPKEFPILTLDADGISLPSDFYLTESKNIANALKSNSLSGFDSEVYQYTTTSNPPPAVVPISARPEVFINSSQLTLEMNQSKSINSMTLKLQADGNLVLYAANHSVLWESDTSGSCSQNCKLAFQEDGNLVLYRDGKPYWASNTTGSGNKLRFTDEPPYVSMLDSNSHVLVEKIVGSKMVTGQILRASTNSAPEIGTNSQVPTPISAEIVKVQIPETRTQNQRPIANDDVLTFMGSQFSLETDQSKSSGNLKILMQADGNLVLYEESRALWASNTSADCVNAKCQALFQDDGNLVLYRDNKPYWATQTFGSGLKLEIKNTAPFVSIKNAAGESIAKLSETAVSIVPQFVANILPASATDAINRVAAAVIERLPAAVAPTKTADPIATITVAPAIDCLIFDGSGLILETNQAKGNASARIQLQEDGNLVVYDKNDSPLWATNTSSNCKGGNCIAVFQADGNFVLYQNNIPIWASNTIGSGYKLKISHENPILSIVGSDGKVIWSQFKLQ
ncbi:MAG: hypothetical protein H7061_05135 [Bdellovibrionaceae bacterium]|nr:hypothetical protein [Bdellovibrio sp.]